MRFGQTLCAVPDQVIDFLRQREDTETGCSSPVSREFEAGDEVIIRDGPFAGMMGVFQRKSAEERAFVLLDCLGRQNRVNLPRQSLLPKAPVV